MVTRCEICGKVIPKARLEILPTTKRCVDCAKKTARMFRQSEPK